MQYSKTNQIPKKKPTRTQINQKANKELEKLWNEKNIHSCEICNAGFMLTNAHKHKRVWYYDKPDKMLWDYNQVVRLCLSCHMEIEDNRVRTKEVFKKLRGK